jgi:hypothetical protein
MIHVFHNAISGKGFGGKPEELPFVRHQNSQKNQIRFQAFPDFHNELNLQGLFMEVKRVASSASLMAGRDGIMIRQATKTDQYCCC